MTEAFSLDTSGSVRIQRGKSGVLTARRVVWDDLGDFAQGYIRAAMRDIQWPDPAEGHGPSSSVVRYDWLAPETLARIIADCASYQERYPDAVTAEQARAFWRTRNSNSLANWFASRWPALTPTLGDDGRVYLREQG